jgi:RNA 3'-terminal phosphate cyclase (ATP)
MLEIDGSFGEGGGQILRTSLALSLVTNTPFRMINVRPRRSRPGLLRQHLTALNAAAEIGRAKVTGAELGSREITFAPDGARAGEYAFSVGTAGSTSLVLQTVLPPLMMAREPSRLVLEGGTHNPTAPPFDFLDRAFLPFVRRIGPRVNATLERPGFYPAGGGRMVVEIEPAEAMRQVHVEERGALRATRVYACVSKLPVHIAEREVETIREKTGWADDCFRTEVISTAMGPGNIVLIDIESEQVTEVFAGFGEKGVAAERVADYALGCAQKYLESGAVASHNLTDQLLIPMALAGGGSFTAQEISLHTSTNAEVIRRFLPVHVEFIRRAKKLYLVTVII